LGLAAQKLFKEDLNTANEINQDASLEIAPLVCFSRIRRQGKGVEANQPGQARTKIRRRTKRAAKFCGVDDREQGRENPRTCGISRPTGVTRVVCIWPQAGVRKVLAGLTTAEEVISVTMSDAN